MPKICGRIEVELGALIGLNHQPAMLNVCHTDPVYKVAVGLKGRGVIIGEMVAGVAAVNRQAIQLMGGQALLVSTL